MRRARSSVYLYSPTANPQAVTRGLAWLRAVAPPDPGKRKALFAVRAKADLGSLLDGVVAGPRIQQFKTSEHLKLGNLHLQLLTLRTGPSYWEGPVLAVDPTAPVLNAVDDYEAAPAVCVISWNREEIQGWIQRWNASLLDVQHPLPACQLPAFSNPAVGAQLYALTRRVNLLTGITDPSDREAARECFTTLRDAGTRYDGLEIENWLITKGAWKVADAAEVRQLAEAIQQRPKPT